MWLATRRGISKVEGSELTHFSTQNGLAHNEVREICESPDGLLWFATLGGLSSYNGTQFTNYTTTQGLAHNVVGSIECSQEKTIWIGTENGVSRFNYAIHAYDATNGLVKDDGGGVSVFDIVHGSDKQTYIGTAWGGIFKFNGNQFTRVFPESGDLYIRNMLEIDPSTYVLGTHVGLLSYSMQGEANNLTVYKNKEWNIALEKDADGFLWTGQGFTGGGLSKYDPATGERLERYFMEDGLPNNHVWSLMHTAEGLWVGSGAGIGLLQDGAFSEFAQ